MIGNLTTLAAVKLYLNITVTTSDTLLESLITQLSLWAQRVRMQRTIAVSAYDKLFQGTGQHVYAFNEWPVVSVTSVRVGTRTLIANTDYWFTDTMLYLNNGLNFVPGVQCRVAWTAGYATTPQEIELAVIELVAFAYRERDRIGLSTQTLGGAETVVYITDPSTKRALQALDAYRKVFQS